MPTGIWVAGPAELHVGVGAGGGLAFLGWSAEGVRVRLQPLWHEVRSDLTGDEPTDVQRQGETAVVSCDLAVWDETVLGQCQSRGNPTTGIPGVWGQGDYGALMVTEGIAFRLLVYPPFSASKPTQAGQQVYNFPRAWLSGPDDAYPIGSKPKRVRTIFRCIPLRDPATGSRTLYDEVVSGKPPAI